MDRDAIDDQIGFLGVQECPRLFVVSDVAPELRERVGIPVTICENFMQIFAELSRSKGDYFHFSLKMNPYLTHSSLEAFLPMSRDKAKEPVCSSSSPCRSHSRLSSISNLQILSMPSLGIFKLLEPLLKVLALQPHARGDQ